MNELTYTLLSDGSSDRGLLPILSWLLGQHLPHARIQRQWADLSRVRRPRQPLSATIDFTIRYYPCNLLFVHRDAETAPRGLRVTEITEARSKSANPDFPAVCVVPVRMTEAWLLLDEEAIRRAAGNPRGHVALELPRLRDVEQLPDPKALLRKLLLAATELPGRRLKKFRGRVSAAARDVGALISDFTPLRQLSAFSAMEEELQQLIRERGW